MKIIVILLLIISSIEANKLQDSANANLELAKTNLKYQSYNRFSILQYTKALKRMFYDKKHEWVILDKIKNEDR